MRIVIISDWFSEKMGYAENCLPKAIAALGHEVHLITSNVQTYFNSPIYKTSYEPFLGPGIVKCGVKEYDGYTLHRLQHGYWRGRLRIRGLLNKVQAIRPQIVQTFDAFSPSTYDLVLGRLLYGYKLFLESHMHASVFPPARQCSGIRNRFKWLLYAATLGRLVSIASEKCYPISQDAADIVIRFFGMRPSKVEIVSLGVDTDLFYPIRDDVSASQRRQLRQQLGYSNGDIVCIYSGRFTEDKNPLCLAKAIDELVGRGEPFRGLFIGNGPQSAVVSTCRGCQLHPFVPTRELPPLYRASDIGVWPKQESTSQLDAAACGLPLVVSNHLYVRERIEGNGLMYEENNSGDLAEKLRSLSNKNVRIQMGALGAKKMREKYSWEQIAIQRIKDYQEAM
jgi:glycosyltransferase involved in cell wall biosynthesis